MQHLAQALLHASVLSGDDFSSVDVQTEAATSCTYRLCFCWESGMQGFMRFHKNAGDVSGTSSGLVVCMSKTCDFTLAARSVHAWRSVYASSERRTSTKPLFRETKEGMTALHVLAASPCHTESLLLGSM